MTSGAERGFTIIEVMLFLAITGALFAALMIGVNNGVVQQRYLDSVRSYKSLLQQQYSEVVNVRNENLDGKCNNDGSINDQVSRSTPRGTSPCVLLGRAIRITYDNGAQHVVTSSITGHDPTGFGQDADGDGIDDSTQINGASDVTALTVYYHAKLAIFDKETEDLDWQSLLTTVASQGQRTPSKAVILIMKSPATGLVRVFASEDTNGALNNNNDLTAFINNTAATTLQKNCVDGNSGLLPKQLVVVNPQLAGPDAIATSDDPAGECN